MFDFPWPFLFFSFFSMYMILGKQEMPRKGLVFISFEAQVVKGLLCAIGVYMYVHVYVYIYI